MTIERYDMTCEYSKFACEDVIVPVACSDGSYVMYYQHEALVEDLAEEIKDLRKEYQSLCDQINRIYMGIP